MALILKNVGSDQIKVIRVYREVTGLGLAESKDAVVSAEAGIAVTIPLLPTVSEDDAVRRFAEAGALAQKGNGLYANSNAFDRAVMEEDTHQEHSGNMQADSVQPTNVPPKSAPDAGTLGREETMANLVEAGKIAKSLQELSIRKTDLSMKIVSEKKQAEAIRNQISAEAKRKLWLIPAILVLTLTLVYGLGIFLAIIVYFARKKKIISEDLAAHSV